MGAPDESDRPNRAASVKTDPTGAQTAVASVKTDPETATSVKTGPAGAEFTKSVKTDSDETGLRAVNKPGGAEKVVERQDSEAQPPQRYHSS